MVLDDKDEDEDEDGSREEEELEDGEDDFCPVRVPQIDIVQGKGCGGETKLFRSIFLLWQWNCRIWSWRRVQNLLDSRQSCLFGK